MRVLLCRHAESIPGNPALPDAARPLAQAGIRDQQRVASILRGKGIVIDLAWVSPFLRARQTLDILLATLAAGDEHPGNVMGSGAGVRAGSEPGGEPGSNVGNGTAKVAVEVVDDLEPWGDADVVMGRLRRLAFEKPSCTILLVGHNPIVSKLFNRLVPAGASLMATSDVACIEWDGDEGRLEFHVGKHGQIS